MSKQTLDQLKNAFSRPEKGESLPNNYFPFWNMNIGDQAIIRFLRDKNEENPMGFLVEKLMHNLVINGERKSVPCLKMYHEDCPVCKVSQNFYKQGDEDNGKKYWRKKQYLGQVLVIEDPLPPNQETAETHEGKVRNISLGWQIFSVIKDALESGELDEIPFAYEGGTNFVIKKTQQGDYATYSIGSKFARKATDLTDDEVALCEESLIDISTLLPKHPGTDKIEAMLEAALTGKEFTDAGATSKSSPKSSSPSEDDYDMEQQSDEDIDDVIAQIRNRRKSSAE